jgi:LPPG:FO 2-phospho-L-lactate transferase
MKIVALAGGVGGAKLVDGLAGVLSPEELTVIVNTGDDFEHLGLYICPDLDTICYTLAGMANPETGWGRINETWRTMENLKRLGGPGWFQLGDQDLATHLERTRRIKEHQPLSQIVREFCRRWEIKQTVLPMSDQIVRTVVQTDQGNLDFQEYFVQRECKPYVKGFIFFGIEKASIASGVIRAIDKSDAVVICPSNPWVSIGPILALPGMKSKLQTKQVFAVSPIIGGEAVKGPAAKMYRELGLQPTALAVAKHYIGLATGFILDKADAEYQGEIEGLKMWPFVTETLMKSPKDRQRLAKDVLNFIGSHLQ